MLVLSPIKRRQRSLKARAVEVSNGLAQTRLLLFVQAGNSLPTPFLTVFICWLAIICTSFTLFLQLDLTVVAAVFVFAWSAAGDNLPDPGTEPAIRGADAGFQRTVAECVITT